MSDSHVFLCSVNSSQVHAEAAQPGLPPATEPALISPVEVELDRLGSLSLEYLERGKKLCLMRALVVRQAKQLTNRLGRGSEFPGWLERYAPDLSRKQADRLAAIIEFFGGDNLDRLSDFKPLAEFFHLTALYQLSTSRVTDAARDEALAIAKSGQLVTASDAQSIIRRHQQQPHASAAARPRSTHREVLTVSNVRITIAGPDLSLVSRLKDAVKTFAARQLED